jgi:hypothetical protein
MSESVYYEVDKITDVCLRGKKILVRIQWKGYDSGSSTWEPIENVNQNGLKQFLEALIEEKPAKKHLVLKLLRNIYADAVQCEEITLSSDTDEHNESFSIQETHKRLSSRNRNKIGLDSDQIVRKVISPKEEGRNSSQKKRKVKLIKPFRDRKEGNGKIENVTKLKVNFEDFHNTKQEVYDNNLGLNEGGDKSEESEKGAKRKKEKIKAPKFQKVVQNIQNCFYITNSNQTILNKMCFNMSNFRHSFCSYKNRSPSPFETDFMYADIHTIVSPRLIIKGLQGYYTDDTNKEISFRCKVIENSTKVVRNLDSLYIEIPQQCFSHLKRKLAQLVLVKKFYQNFFEKITAV